MVPLRGTVPLHAPLAVQAVVLVDDHVRAAALPVAMLCGSTEMLTVGATPPSTKRTFSSPNVDKVTQRVKTWLQDFF